MSGVPQKLTIDIVSDVVCPWCAIGYKGLEQALSALGDRVEASVTWHPFELASYLPAGGQLLSDYVRERYGAPAEQSQKSRQRIVDAGAAVGLDFRYSEGSRIYNFSREDLGLMLGTTVETASRVIAAFLRERLLVRRERGSRFFDSDIVRLQRVAQGR